MSRVALPPKRAALAAMLAGGLAAGAVLTLALRAPMPAARADTSHAMMEHGAGHAAAEPAAVRANEIVIDDFAFGPTALTVRVGTKVTWINDDSDPHTVTSADDSKLLKSPPLDTGDTFAFTFDKPGTYRYFCSIHPHMQGVVVVE